MRPGDDDTLPLDEMDPCCAKELAHEEAKTRVGRELRKTDRSMVRYDMRQRAIDDLRNGARSCACCSAPADYYLLLKLRQEAEAEEEARQAAAARRDEEEKERRRRGGRGGDSSNSDDDDDDDDDFGLDDCYTDYEVAAMEEMKTRALAFGRAKLVGLGVHVEQSAAHLEKMIPTFKHMVLHIYNPRSALQARINLHLEVLATRYPGTLFRRVESGPQVSQLVSKLQGTSVRLRSAELGDSDYAGALVAIVGASSTAFTSQLESFGSDDELLPGEIDKWLSNTGALCTDTEDALSFASLRQVAADAADADDEAAYDAERDTDCAAYCDLPGCPRTFPHEHIAGGTGGLGSLSVRAAQEGESVFAPGLLGRV